MSHRKPSRTCSRTQLLVRTLPLMLLFAAGVAPCSAQSSVKPAPSGSSAGAFAGWKKRQSMVKGLVVVELSSSNLAGKATQMNATLMESAGGETVFRFNQEVGPSMNQALREVFKHLSVVHGRIPSGFVIEVAFEDKYSPKDGPSAAVACALLLDSLLTGEDIDPKFAVTGDLNADGAVQPVGGVSAKIRGAAKRDCTHVAIPTTTAGDVADLYLTEGPKSLLDIQIFTIKTLGDAKALGSEKKSGPVMRAMSDFAEIQRVIEQKKDFSLLANAKVQERLRQITEATPNHLSASILLQAAQGKGPKALSLRGSLAAIDKSAGSLLQNAKAPKPEGVDTDQLAVALADLTRIRPKLDARTTHYADSIATFGTLLRTYKNKPPRSGPETLKAMEKIQEAGRRVDTEVEKMRSNKDLMEEMLR